MVVLLCYGWVWLVVYLWCGGLINVGAELAWVGAGLCWFDAYCGCLCAVFGVLARVLACKVLSASSLLAGLGFGIVS